MEPAKAWSLFRMRVTGELQVFQLYGMGVYIPQVTKEVEAIARQLIEELRDNK